MGRLILVGTTWCGHTTQQRLTLLEAGIKYNFFAVKGFDATRFERDYNVLIQTSMGSDGGAQTLDMARRRWPIFISPASTPDGNWPGNP